MEEKQILHWLDKLNIQHKVIHHQPVWHMETSPEFDGTTLVKNMLLYDKQTNMFYLNILLGDEKVDYKKLSQALNISRKHLRFATDSELKSELGIISGMVSPLIVKKNTDNIQFVISTKLRNLNNLGFHAGTNTETVVISFADLLKYAAFLNVKTILA